MSVFQLCSAFILAIIIHEGGHWIAIRFFGYHAHPALTRKGPVMRVDFGPTMPPRRTHITVALAGPVASALGGYLFWLAGWDLWIFVALIGVVQVIPFRGSDGWQIWRVVHSNRSKQLDRKGEA